MIQILSLTRNAIFVTGAFVLLTGIEPARLSTPDPKSGASPNSATKANKKPHLKRQGYYEIEIY